MQINQIVINDLGSTDTLSGFFDQPQDFSFAFGGPKYFKDAQFSEAFAKCKVPVIGCSTAGEISLEGVGDDSLVMTSIKFEKGSQVKTASGVVSQSSDSFKAGKEIGEKLKNSDLKIAFILGTGTNVNGSELIRGLEDVLGSKVAVTGGLAGDNGEFKLTHTLLNGKISENTAVAVGFYGTQLKVGYGSQGGWKPFGPARKITKAEGNILFELDGESALSVYETYLGDKAKDLPSSGLLYPFAIVEGQNEDTGLIRTILGIDKEQGSLTLAGDVPEGGLLKLMHTGSDGLVAGAEGAAENTMTTAQSNGTPGLGLLVSCVGRKLVMGQDTDEEVEAVQDILPKGSVVTGFYSYGEICPFEKTNRSMLHNQTMTITFLTEG